MTIAAPLWQSPFHRALVPLLMAASLVPIWSSPYFPSQNGPWHLLTIQMMHEYGNPAFNYAEFYVPSIHAIPHLAHTLLVYSLAFVFPVLVAHQIAISLYALLVPISVFTFLGTVSPTRMAGGYVSFLLIYNVPLLRGYHDYVLGIPLVLLTLTYWLRHRDDLNPRHIAVTMLLIACVYLSHIFNFLMLGLAMLVCTLHGNRTIGAIGRLALLFAPAALLLADFAIMSVRQTQWMEAEDLEWLAPHSALEGFFHNFFNTMSPTAYLLAALPLLVAAFFLLKSWATAYRDRGRSISRVVLLNPWVMLVLLCVALYFVTPFKLFGWHYVNARFVPYVIVFAIASYYVSRNVPPRAFVVSTAVASFGIFALMAVQIKEASSRIEEYLSAVEKVRPNSVMLPLSTESETIGRISPLAHAHDYYPLFRGGANGKGIARFNTVTPLVYRSYPIARRFPGWRSTESTDLGPVSSVYDYVLIWGPDPEATQQLHDAEFDLVHEQGKLRLFENRRRKPSQQAGGHE